MTSEGTGKVISASSAPPLLTFLIADMRGYTRFTNEQGDEAAARLAERFASISEAVLAEYEGRVIELRGDEALAVFSSARNALRGAVALQQAFKQAVHDEPCLPLTVGMGLDAGEAIPVRGGYRGGALNLAARLCSIAGAGEILASEGVVHLARRTEGLAFVDRGQVTLKGLATPVRVLQIAPEGAIPEELPPLQPILVTHPTNLLDEPMPFIGREGEISQIARLVRNPHIRLVTLTGPGGTGKTRLALQVGLQLVYDFKDGVFFCDLAPLNGPALVPSVIAEVLGIKSEGGQSIDETLIASLKEKHLLLVLDNFEHVLDACEVVGRLLGGCRELNIMVTSRIPLHLAREQEHAVPPLQVPDPAHVVDAVALSQYESVALFVQRARAAKDSFALTNENAPAVAGICVRLDGLPLAIELAAARIKLFPPQALLQRLDSRLKVLTSGARDKPTRQQTLRGTMDWSYSLLTEDEQALFARLSVFAGGCTFAAAEMVCNEEGRIDLFEELASLVDKSLVRQEGEQEPRFSMLETIREYAAERLGESGEGESIRDAHAAYFVSLGEQAYSTFKATVDPALLDELDQEHNNMRAALSWLEARSQWAAALRLVAGLWWFWWIRGHIGEGRRQLEVILANTQDTVSAERASAMMGASLLAMVQGAFAEAGSLIRSAVELAREAGDDAVLGDVLMTHGLCSLRQGNTQLAKSAYEESLALARVSGRLQRIAIVTRALGAIAQREGDVARGMELIEESVTIHRELHDVWELSTDYLSLGLLANQRGELARAERYFRDSLRLAQRIRETDKIAYLLDVLGCLAVAREDHRRAAHLFAAADALWGTVEVRSFRRTVEVAFPDNDREMRTRCEVAAREVLGGEWSVVQRAATAMSPDEAVAYALAERG